MYYSYTCFSANSGRSRCLQHPLTRKKWSANMWGLEATRSGQIRRFQFGGSAALLLMVDKINSDKARTAWPVFRHTDIGSLLVRKFGQDRIELFNCGRATFSSRCFGSTYTPIGYFLVLANNSICAST